MRLLAIDPGPTESAFVEYAGGCLFHSGKRLNRELKNWITGTILCAGSAAEILVIERVAGMGMAVGQEVFDTCHWSGRFHQAWLDLGRIEGSVYLVKRLPVKLHLCGSARAKDSNIRQTLIDRFGKPGTKKEPGALYGVSGDVWQALALAVAFEDGVR